MLDLQAYFRRIDYTGDLDATRSTLEALHLAHATHIPFENLDILMGRPIRLDLESLQAKLVSAGRGGYCFEHNLLFAAVLEEIGFPVTRLAARVRYGTDRVLPRTHMLLLVTAGGGNWLADVGFGAGGLLTPVPFGTGEVSRQFLWSYRVVEKDRLWALQTLRDGVWMDLYAFTLEPQEYVDYVMANHFTSTHPTSRFVQTLTAQMTRPEARTTLRNYELTIDTGTRIEREVLAAQDDVIAALSRIFGLQLPAGTRFRVLADPQGT
jgi:N-hydroxyarylamine O-acetyltransferase